jgi:hypothetical protein
MQKTVLEKDKNMLEISDLIKNSSENVNLKNKNENLTKQLKTIMIQNQNLERYKTD